MYRIEYRETTKCAEIDGCRVKETTEIYLFETKSAAFKFFEESIAEHYRGKDFWDDVYWDDISVSSSHSDECGASSLILFKWEGFDNDIELAWEYNGKKYHSIEDLWDNEPKFSEERMETDKPFIRSKDGDEVATLVVNNLLN